MRGETDMKRSWEEYDDQENEEIQEPEIKLTRQERRWVIMGALKSVLLIASVYVIAGALLIWLLLKIWN